MAKSKGQKMAAGFSHGPHGHGGHIKMSPNVSGSNSHNDNPFTESSGHTVHGFGGGKIQGE